MVNFTCRYLDQPHNDILNKIIFNLRGGIEVIQNLHRKALCTCRQNGNLYLMIKINRIISLFISGVGAFCILYALFTWDCDFLWPGLVYLAIGILGYKYPEYIR